MNQPVLNSFKDSRKLRQKKMAVLIDPDKSSLSDIDSLVELIHATKVDYIFAGGSLLTKTRFTESIAHLKSITSVPVILFPGSVYQVSNDADAILFLSLISGRNPDLLIGKHVEAVPLLLESRLEVISTGYMLIDGGASTTASYISNTFPIPADKPEIAKCTALAGQFLGMQSIYLDAGSGAQNAVPTKMIKAVSSSINVPLIVGGGLRTPQLVFDAASAGADIVVIGNILEKSPGKLPELRSALDDAFHSAQMDLLDK